MAGSKAALKAMKDAIAKQKWDDAISLAQDVFDKDPKNYLG